MITTIHIVTPEELEAMDPDGERYEVVKGDLREVVGVGMRHGRQEARLVVYLGTHVYEHDLGELFTSDTRFVIPTSPPSVFAPDLTFIKKERLPEGEVSVGYSYIIPDLVAEIASPSQYGPELLQRVALYLAGGVPMVWLIRPAVKTLTVFRLDAPELTLGIDDTLDGGDIVPGFTLPLKLVFRR